VVAETSIVVTTDVTVGGADSVLVVGGDAGPGPSDM
jgi:hypothetical protein